jgi:hypothetical protein
MQAAAPATISLWYFDETKGIWKRRDCTKQSTNYVGNRFTLLILECRGTGADVQLDATFKNDSTGLALTNKLVAIISVNFGTRQGYTDNNGKISGLVPANEALRLKVSDDCETIYAKDIGPLSTNTDLGNINVRSRCSLFDGTVNGTVINCSNAAVTNGHVKVTAGNNTFNAAINNGSFSISYSYFSNSISTATLTAYDSNTGDSSRPVPINGLQGSVNMGQVIACTAVTSATG